MKVEDFITKSNNLHNHKYIYSKSVYIGSGRELIIICPLHGEFPQKPCVHIAGGGCPICGNIKRRTKLNDFIVKSNNIHNYKYTYHNVVYINAKIKVTITCPIHGDFPQIPNDHLTNHGCPKCANKQVTTEEFIAKSQLIHGDTYAYSYVNYINNTTEVIITCKIHGNFTQTPNIHLNGCGCKQCSPRGYSSISVKWLKSIMEIENIFIQHAENIGEYKLPNTNYRVDGFCKETNTVYEYHGDCFHGNPNIYNTNEICSPFSKSTAGELYQQTTNREQIIKKLGYNLVVVWGSEYNKSIKNKGILTNEIL